MNNLVIACSTIQEEVRKAMAKAKKEYPIIWMDSSLHEFPEKLSTALQEEINKIENVENILLCYGLCGNALLGIKSNKANLILPKADDCISILLWKCDHILEDRKETYFLTKEWIDSDRGILEDYKHTIEKYGCKKAHEIFKIMLNHYKYLMLIDTKTYSIEEYTEKAKKMAETLDLEMIIRKGNIDLLKKLFTGPWDEDFCRIERGEAIELKYFMKIK